MSQVKHEVVNFTTMDGWDCVPELSKVSGILSNVDDVLYEIKNCVRVSDLDDMVRDLTQALNEASEILNSIDTHIEYVTIDEE